MKADCIDFGAAVVCNIPVCIGVHSGVSGYVVDDFKSMLLRARLPRNLANACAHLLPSTDPTAVQLLASKLRKGQSYKTLIRFRCQVLDELWVKSIRVALTWCSSEHRFYQLRSQACVALLLAW